MRRDQLTVGDSHPIEWAIQIGGPKIQEIDELRKVRREVVVLPNIALQKSRIIRQAVKNPAVVRENPSSRRNKAASGIGDSYNHFGITSVVRDAGFRATDLYKESTTSRAPSRQALLS